MNFEGNPFFGGFREQRYSETLAKRVSATYNNPMETVENIPSYPHPTDEDENAAIKTHFFDQNFGVSPNPAHITGCTALDPQPYIIQSTSESEEEEDCKEETVQTDGESETKE